MGLGRSRDQRIADHTHDDADLMCSAHGCPNRWSVDAGSGRLCSAHAWVERHEWPRVTQGELDAAAETAFRKANRMPEPPSPVMKKADKVRLLNRLRSLFTPAGQDAKAWARRLRQREQSGEKLSEFQRACWRDALRDSLPDAAREAA